MVLSSSVIYAYQKFNAPYMFLINQLKWVIVGSICMFASLKINVKSLRKFSRAGFIAINIVLFLLVIYGPEVKGAKRWFDFGLIRFQPVELLKLVMIIFVADYIDRKKSKLQTPAGLFNLLAILSIPLILVMVQPDLGSIIVISAVIVSMLYVGGVKKRHILALLLIGLALLSFETVRYDYRKQRFRNFISHLTKTEDVASGVTEGGVLRIKDQQDAAKVAIERGGWLGAGPGQSHLKLFYLPEAHTDFIFAIIGEEFGFVAGSLIITALFLLILAKGIKISLLTDDYFSRLLTLGIVLSFSFQAIFHVGVSCGMLPAKGLTLPFVSFGGSSLVVSMLMAGILLNMSAKVRE